MIKYYYGDGAVTHTPCERPSMLDLSFAMTH